MLFSNERVATFINDNFEPVWVSVRPVPRVTIDFGNGSVIKRTLHGNIATWVCDSDGTAVDILPGIYDADSYQQALSQLAGVHKNLKLSHLDKKTFLHRYHESMAGAKQVVSSQKLPGFKGVGQVIKGLAEDTNFNEGKRRRLIHEYLKSTGPAKPATTTKWLYREILNADLDDPYLGLGEKLFAYYPFADEDEG